MIIPSAPLNNITAPEKTYGPNKSSKMGGDSANRNYYHAGRRKKFGKGKGSGPAVVVALSEKALGIEGEEEAVYFIYDQFGRLKKCGV